MLANRTVAGTSFITQDHVPSIGYSLPCPKSSSPANLESKVSLAGLMSQNFEFSVHGEMVNWRDWSTPRGTRYTDSISDTIQFGLDNHHVN